MIDVGGGVPSCYPGMEPPPLEDYFAIIHRHFEALPIAYNAELWCEPGRALSAEYNSLIVKVEKRRGGELFINDGAYGPLYDAAHVESSEQRRVGKEGVVPCRTRWQQD